MTNKNKTVWSNRFKSSTSKSFQRIGSSINIDKRLYEQDILLLKCIPDVNKNKIIPAKEGRKIIKGLDKIKNQIQKGKFIFREKFEDIHLNIEKKLHDIIGNSAGYMHTARSRNDQVVTDFKLWVKESTLIFINELNL